MKRFVHRFERVINGPQSRIVIGAIVVGCAAMEMADTAFEELIGLDIKTYMGVIALGLQQVLSATAELVLGMWHIEAGREMEAGVKVDS